MWYASCMTSALLLAMFLRHFTVDEDPPPPTPTYRELRRESSPSSLSIEAVPVTGGIIPPGASRVKMMDLNMSASCEGSDVNVINIGLVRKGMGDYRDILRVYAMSDNRRVGPSIPLTRKDGRVDLRMRGTQLCHTRSGKHNRISQIA